MGASRFRSDADDEKGLYSPNFKRTYFKRTFGATRCSKVLHPGFDPGFALPGFFDLNHTVTSDNLLFKKIFCGFESLEFI